MTVPRHVGQIQLQADLPKELQHPVQEGGLQDLQCHRDQNAQGEPSGVVPDTAGQDGGEPPVRRPRQGGEQPVTGQRQQGEQRPLPVHGAILRHHGAEVTA